MVPRARACGGGNSEVAPSGYLCRFLNPAWVGVRSNSDATRPRGSRRLPPRPTAAELVGPLASIGLSDAKFNRIRVFFGGALSPMTSLQVCGRLEHP